MRPAWIGTANLQHRVHPCSVPLGKRPQAFFPPGLLRNSTIFAAQKLGLGQCSYMVSSPFARHLGGWWVQVSCRISGLLVRLMPLASMSLSHVPS